MGVDARGFPGGLLGLDPAFAYVEPPSSWPLPRAECLTLASNSCSIMSDSLWSCRLYPTKLLQPWGFSRQEYWSGWPFSSPGDPPNPGIKPASPAFQVDSLPSEPPGKCINGFWEKSYCWRPSIKISITYNTQNLFSFYNLVDHFSLLCPRTAHASAIEAFPWLWVMLNES